MAMTPLSDLQCALAVAVAERNQADEMVLKQEELLEALKKELAHETSRLAEANRKLTEWEDLELWRQTKMSALYDEVEALRAEVATLKRGLAAKTQ